ncbi:hypothetical protein ACQ7OT_06190 [Micrococcus luteus]
MGKASKSGNIPTYVRWRRLFKKSGFPLGGGFRVTLAGPEDSEFLGRMTALAGLGESVALLEHPRYAEGLRAGAARMGGYWRAVTDVYNRTGEAAGVNEAIVAAVSAASFDLICWDGEERVAALSVGTSWNVLNTFADRRLDPRQIVGLLNGLPKARALAVVPERRDEGIATVFLDMLGDLVGDLGTIALFGECSEDLVEFYRAREFVVLAKGQPLNVSVMAGEHAAGGKIDLDDGPRIQAEPGYRMMYMPAGRHAENESERVFLALNQPR